MKRGIFVRFVLATWGGWVLGVPLIAALALAAEAAGVGGAQVFVGAGMGMGIGLGQGRVVRGVLQRAAPWFWSCVVGLAAPFLVSDVAKVAGATLPYSLLWCVAAGGIVVGLWQAVLLRARFRSAWAWVAASAVGWLLAAGTSSIADALFKAHKIRGISGLLAYLGLIASGGLVLGLVTGPCLAWLVRREKAG